MNDGASSSQQQQQESNQEFEYCLDDILASANFEPDPHAVNASAKPTAYGASAAGIDDGNCAPGAAGQSGLGESATAQKPSVREAADALRNEPPSDRRRRRRALITAPVRVRGINVTDAVVDEISSTIDVSRAGILFISSSPNYARGMEVAVIFPYSTAPTALHAEQQGRIVRSFETPEGRYAVAVAIGEGIGEDVVDSCGRKLMDASPVPRMPLAPPAAPIGSNSSVLSLTREPNSKRPLVLVVDADEMVRTTLKGYLGSEGYDVMAVSNSQDAREVMNLFTPALVIAEVEGEGLPGYDLCAYVKQSPRLKHIPVLLTTSSGYPSDYANAHSLGATVCMTKPYKQERLGHVVRLLAPPPAEFCAQKNGAAAPRPADPSRRCGYGNAGANGSSANGAAKLAANGKLAPNPLKRLKFPSFR
jgi:twitching motility two-component system response regulator PilG